VPGFTEKKIANTVQKAILNILFSRHMYLNISGNSVFGHDKNFAHYNTLPLLQHLVQ
jgi:hypothetical protein